MPVCRHSPGAPHVRTPFFRPTPLALCLALTLAQPATAATDAERLQALEKSLASSQNVIEQLQRRLAELESKPATSTATSAATSTRLLAAANPAAADTERRVETLERSLGDMASALSARKPADDTGLALHGFLDVNWAQASPAGANGRNGFQLGVLDLYLTPQFGDRVRSLIEVAFEYGASGALATDVERLQIGYVVNDDLVLWGGRFHTPFGYWNTAFHHGAQIQTSISRPRFLGFEDAGGILPSHSVGLWASGKQATAWGKLGYDVYVSNGNRISEGVLDFNASGDDNSSPALGFNLSLAPKALPGLTLGVHGMRQTVAGENGLLTQTGRARMQFLGGYGFFENDDWELIGELYQFNNRDLSGGAGRQRSWAGYLQAGYTVAPRWVVFGRTEKASLSGSDPYFALQTSGSSYQQWTAGLRFDLDPRAALKLQIDRNVDAANAAGAVNTLRAQYAIRF